ncbi:hypothetical protein GCM10011416_14460 [Polaribacter pacificus]|uniref:Outer membrane protein beta-barrel domain-containing protein n=1 Tax=Polaribacter pacificus TaxID=1775173 RepID=A0A917I047_9FLAO|nr:porin family protein [Polaribacter pacificus]GGG97556.1 hypothetical protein GCM10011416_14460 [Polaribacter pacificus]
MKKLLLFIFLVSTISITSNAQKKITYGLKGGVSISNISSDSYYKSIGKKGIYLGGLAEFYLKEKFSIQGEVLFAIYGAEVYPITYGGNGTKTEIDLDYILVPVLAKFYMSKHLSVEIGPSFNFLINEKGYRPNLPDIIDSNGNFLRSQKEMDPYGSSIELSALIGVSYKLSRNLSINLRYTRGLTNTFNPPFQTSKKGINEAFQLGIDFLF